MGVGGSGDDVQVLASSNGDLYAAGRFVRTGDNVSSMDQVDAESWLDDGDGRRLFAQTLRQAEGHAATLLICESDDRHEVDLPRFR